MKKNKFQDSPEKYNVRLELIEYFENKTRNSIKTIFQHNPSLLDKAFEAFYWCKNKSELNYCIFKKILYMPICPICKEKKLKFNGKNYSKTCGKKECKYAKVKETVKERYGVDNPMKSEKIKEKIKKTNLEKYGVDNPLKSEKIKEKIKQTNLKRYGVEWSLSSKEVREKIKKTNLEKYGSINPGSSEKIKEKIKQTNLKRYGVEWSLSS